ncbi:MAG: hypothetical protein U0800_26025 [Isosphaeraceae bacterium]
MSAPNTTAAAGTTVTRGSVIANVTSVKGGGVEVGERNTTHLGSAWKSCEPTLPKGSDLTIEVNYLPSSHAAMVAECAAGTKTSTVIHFPADTGGGTGGTLTFVAFIKSIEFGGVEEDGTVNATITYTPVESVAAA